jgi:hypothetical protein
MEIDGSSRQSSNADLPISETLQSSPKVTLDSPLHEQKQSADIVSRDNGKQIDRSAVQYENAPSPRTESLEAGSNVNEKFGHLSKQPFEIVWTDAGRQND